MNKEAPIVPEEIELFNIDIVKSEIKDKGSTKHSKSFYNLQVAHKTGHNLEDERIKIKLLINLSEQPKASSINEANFEIDFHFKILKLDKYYTLNEDKIPIISGNLIATILGISFSTARGLLYERLANTNLQGVILPIVSPKKMLETKLK